MKVLGGKNIGTISLSLLIITSTLVIISNSTSYADAEEQTEANTVTSSSGSDEVAAASGSNRFVVWEDETPATYYDKTDIFFRRSTDNGATWKPTVNLSNNLGPSKMPQIAVSGSNVYVAWYQENNEYQLPNIFFKRSTDNGATWGAKINISVSGTVKDSAFELAASGGNVYLVWSDKSGNDWNDWDIFFRRSTDNGATWKSKVNLSNNDNSLSGSPHIAASGSNVYVAWEDPNGSTEVLFRRSTDNGATWKSALYLDTNGDYSSFPRQLVASGSNVYVVWDSLVGEIFLRRSTDNGATWKTAKNLSNSAESSHVPQLAVSGSNVYVVWREDNPNEGDILFRRSVDNGATWKSAVNLSNNPGASSSPHLAVSGSNVYVAWGQSNAEETASDSFFRRSTDNGATWKTKVNLSSNGNSGGPDLAVTGSNVYAVWTHGGDIFFQRSTDNGATWGSTKNLSNNSGSSFNPQIAA